MSLIVALGTYEGNLLGYDCQKRKMCFGYTPHLGCVKSLNARGHHLCSASTDDTCRLFDLRQRKDIGGFMAHEGSVEKTLVLSRHVVTAGVDGKICVWRLADLELLTTIAKSQAVTAMAVDPTEKILLTAHADKRLRMWDLRDGKPVWSLALDLNVSEVAFSADSEWIAILPADGLNTQVVHMASSRVESVIRTPTDRVTTLCFSGNDLLLGDLKGNLRVLPVGRAGDEDSEEEEDSDEEAEAVPEAEANAKSVSDEVVSDETSPSPNAVKRVPFEEWQLRHAKTPASADSSDVPPPVERIRLMSVFENLCAVVLSTGTVELWDVQSRMLVLTFDIREDARCTSVALAFVKEEAKKEGQKANKANGNVSSKMKTSPGAEGNMSEEEEDSAGAEEEESSDLEDEVETTSVGSSEGAELSESEESGSQNNHPSVTDLLPKEVCTMGQTKKKKRGMRAGIREKISKMQRLEEHLKDHVIKKGGKKAKKVGAKGSKNASSVQASDERTEKIRALERLARLSNAKTVQESRRKKKLKMSDQKRMAEFREKEEKAAAAKTTGKEERRKKREKQKEDEK